MPDSRLPPGLYERLVSLALEREIGQLDKDRRKAWTEPPEPVELPRLLSRYVSELLQLALQSQTGKDAETKQLDLCRKVLDQLIQADTGLISDDHLKQPAELLTALVETQALVAPKEPTRAAIPLGTGDLLVNARGEPGLGPVLQSEIPSADRIDLLCAFTPASTPRPGSSTATAASRPPTSVPPSRRPRMERPPQPSGDRQACSVKAQGKYFRC